MYAHRVRDPSHTRAYHAQYSHAYPMLIRQGNYLFLVYLWQEIAMVRSVTCSKRDVGIARQLHALQLDVISAEFTANAQVLSALVRISSAVPEVFKTC